MLSSFQLLIVHHKVTSYNHPESAHTERTFNTGACELHERRQHAHSIELIVLELVSKADIHAW